MIATCKSKKLTALAAALLSLLMLLSLCTVSVFAGEADTTADTVADTVADTGSDTTADTLADTTADTTAGTTAETSATTAATTKAETEDSAAAAEKKEKLTRGLINLGVGAVILIVLVILCIKFRAKIPGWWKALKSECGKISWCSKDKLKKNTIVVVIIILAIALAIAILDFVFSEGMTLLGKLVR